MELPVAFVSRTRDLLGDADAELLFSALQEEPPVSIRLNESRLALMENGAGKETGCVPVPWCSSGRYLPFRPSFTFDPLFHAGCYYVQEASSMFVGQAVQQYVKRPVVALDLCAAPGGKSTLLRSLLPDGSLLVANEVMRNRSQVLAENLTKWGHPDVVVTQNDPADFAPLGAFFDVVLADVPCSGEGMFRKDTVASEEWSSENVEICWRRQRRILSDIWPCLKPGGLLLYGTCTYNIYENEENIRWICEELGAEALPLDVAESWNITGNLLPGASFPVYRFFPHRTRGEGFFLAVLRKAGEEESSFSRSGKPKEKKKERSRPISFSSESMRQARSWVKGSDAYEWLTVDVASRDEAPLLSLFPKAYLSHLSLLRRSLRVLQAGVAVGEPKGRDLQPAHSLALSNLLCPEAFPRAELDYPQAVAYLRKEAVSLSSSASRGIVLLTYRSVPIGFVKNIGNRANNLYPQEWRIRSRAKAGEEMPGCDFL